MVERKSVQKKLIAFKGFQLSELIQPIICNSSTINEDHEAHGK